MGAKDELSVLIRLAKDGNQQALAELWRQHEIRLASFVRGRVGEHVRSNVQVEDICQEAFLRAQRSLAQFSWRGEDSLFSWLAEIAGNIIHEIVRSARRELVLAAEKDISVKDPSHASLMRRDERFDRLQAAFRELRPEYRQVISLARIEGLGLKEVAERMGHSHAAARQLLCRALRRLKESFGDTESLHLPPRHLEDPGTSQDE